MTHIRINGLLKTWGEVKAVDNVGFEVPDKSLTVLLGPSGCGKSTILRLIAGLESATSGSIVIEDRDVTDLDPAKRGVSMVFQSYALFPHLSVRENILFGLKVRKVEKQEQEKRLDSAASMVGLSELLDRRPSQLSGGQRQRVALARSIVSRRKICLMDEPLSNLDAKLRAQMREEIHSLQKRLGLTMIYVTHDQVEAMTMADQVVLLNRGRIVQTDCPKTLYDKPADIFAAKFMGAPPMNIIPCDADKCPADFLKDAWDSRTGHSGFIGIRPEHLFFDTKGLGAKIEGKDYLGSETLFKAKYNNMTIFVKTAKDLQLGKGDSVHLSWEHSHTHHFDLNGQRLF